MYMYVYKNAGARSTENIELQKYFMYGEFGAYVAIASDTLSGGRAVKKT